MEMHTEHPETAKSLIPPPSTPISMDCAKAHTVRLVGKKGTCIIFTRDSSSTITHYRRSMIHWNPTHSASTLH